MNNVIIPTNFGYLWLWFYILLANYNFPVILFK